MAYRSSTHPTRVSPVRRSIASRGGGAETYRRDFGYDLTGLGYSVRHAVLGARHSGLPQRRQRLLIVGILGSVPFAFPEPGMPADNLTAVLRRNGGVRLTLGGGSVHRQR